MSELDNLLDSTLDDLEDLPSFQAYPIGVHKVLASLELKEINGKDSVELSFKYIENVEMANASDAIPAAGDTSSTLFNLDNIYGRGNLKIALASFAEVAGTRANREIIEAITDVECVIITGLRKNTNDPDKPYLDVKEIGVL
jgi:hypothetical protein